MNTNIEIKKILTYAVKSTAAMLLRERQNGEFHFINSSTLRQSGLHTHYDKLANKHLIETLLPDLCKELHTNEMLIISEEFDDLLVYITESGSFVKTKNTSKYRGYVLVIDPICGTIPFVRGIPDFVISIAIIHNMQCIVSIVYQPNLRELFYAEVGKGAYINNNPIEAPSNIRTLEEAYISIEHKVFRDVQPNAIQEIARRVMRIRTAGTCALEMCYVACGRIDGLIKLNQSFYDYLPGSLFIQEAGLQKAFVALDGITTILPISDLNRKASFIVTNNHITHQLAFYTQKWIDI